MKKIGLEELEKKLNFTKEDMKFIKQYDNLYGSNGYLDEREEKYLKENDLSGYKSPRIVAYEEVKKIVAKELEDFMIDKLKENFPNLSGKKIIEDVVLKSTMGLTGVYSISSDLIDKYREFHEAIEYNKEHKVEYAEMFEDNSKDFKNHTLDEIIEKKREISRNISMDGGRLYGSVYGNGKVFGGINENYKEIPLSYFQFTSYNRFEQRYSFKEFMISSYNDMYEKIIEGNYNQVKFMYDLIEKYHLTDNQCSILYVNIDLLYTMFINDQMKKNYSNFVANDNIDRIIKNIKLLVPEDFNLTIYSLESLKNNFIFYMDIEKYLSKFSNIKVSDITKLVMMRKFKSVNSLTKFLKILDSVDEIKRDLVIEIYQSIFSDTSIFPNITEEKNHHGVLESGKIIEKNFMFFENYDTYFENLFNEKELLELLNRENVRETLLAILLFKKSLGFNIPKYKDTRYVEKVEDNYVAGYVPEREDVETAYGTRTVETGNWVAVLGSKLNRYAPVGTLEYGARDIENQKNMIELIKELSKSNSFDLDEFLKILSIYKIDKNIYKFISTMIDEYNSLKEKGKVLVK